MRNVSFSDAPAIWRSVMAVLRRSCKLKLAGFGLFFSVAVPVLLKVNKLVLHPVYEPGRVELHHPCGMAWAFFPEDQKPAQIVREPAEHPTACHARFEISVKVGREPPVLVAARLAVLGDHAEVAASQQILVPNGSGLRRPPTGSGQDFQVDQRQLPVVPARGKPPVKRSLISSAEDRRTLVASRRRGDWM